MTRQRNTAKSTWLQLRSIKRTKQRKTRARAWQQKNNNKTTRNVTFEAKCTVEILNERLGALGDNHAPIAQPNRVLGRRSKDQGARDRSTVSARDGFGAHEYRSSWINVVTLCWLLIWLLLLLLLILRLLHYYSYYYYFYYYIVIIMIRTSRIIIMSIIVLIIFTVITEIIIFSLSISII